MKPSNVLLGAPGSGREKDVHLVDFGIAARLAEPRGESRVGTPLFASAAAHEGLPAYASDDIESFLRSEVNNFE